MKRQNLDEKTLSSVRIFQKTEINEHHVYRLLAKRVSGKNGEILSKIAADELRHSQEWQKYTGIRIRPNWLLVFWYVLISHVMGITFTIKMLEKSEEKAEKTYRSIEQIIPAASEILRDELTHEDELIGMIDEDRINYVGSMILGLNDAMVELTGALAGFTLALKNTQLIGLAGLITGLAASLSMAASEYLSQKSEALEKDPLRASLYTGTAYIIVVILLITPYFILNNYYLALLVTLMLGILVILVFSRFVSVVKEISFKKFFWEMVAISLGVAFISFAIGWLARILLKIEA